MFSFTGGWWLELDKDNDSFCLRWLNNLANGNSDQPDVVDSHLDVVEDDVIVELDSVPSAIVLVRSQRDKLVPESNLNKWQFNLSIQSWTKSKTVMNKRPALLLSSDPQIYSYCLKATSSFQACFPPRPWSLEESWGPSRRSSEARPPWCSAGLCSTQSSLQINILIEQAQFCKVLKGKP